MNSVSTATNSAPLWRAQNAASASVSVINVIEWRYTPKIINRERSARQQRLGLFPQAAHDLAGRFAASQSRRLAGPGLHALHVVGACAGLAHRRCQAALYRVGGRG